jgi:uncharacterized protein YndB with AHSA1/START domain
MPAVSTDRIEKQIQLRAPRTKVWKALTDLGQFQQWFGATLTGKFAPGQTVKGHVNAKGYDHVQMVIDVVKLDPEGYFAYRWTPYATDATRDYSTEPKTLVEFTLEEVDGGTRLTVVETGFDRVAADRRDEAFKMHTGGWEGQLKNIGKYVEA